MDTKKVRKNLKMVEMDRQKELAGGQDRNRLHRALSNGECLSAITHCLNDMDLSQEEFRHNLRLRCGLIPHYIPAT